MKSIFRNNIDPSQTMFFELYTSEVVSISF